VIYLNCNFVIVLHGKSLEPQIEKIRLAECVPIGRTEYEIYAHKVLSEDSKKRNHLEDPGVGNEIIRKWILNKRT
jgi:hypothetical protein